MRNSTTRTGDLDLSKHLSHPKKRQFPRRSSATFHRETALQTRRPSSPLVSRVLAELDSAAHRVTMPGFADSFWTPDYAAGESLRSHMFTPETSSGRATTDRLTMLFVLRSRRPIREAPARSNRNTTSPHRCPHARRSRRGLWSTTRRYIACARQGPRRLLARRWRQCAKSMIDR